MRRLLTIIAAFLLFASGHAADDLPRHLPGEAMDFEPGLLPDLAVAPDRAAPDPASTVPRIEAAIERAKKSAASGERLFRGGVIAKVEAEKRALKVVRLSADLAAARLEAAKLDLATTRAEFDAGKLSQEQLDAAQASTDAASAAATTAATAWQRAELAAAELNLSRQRRLLAAAAGSKSMVQRAQSLVVELKKKSPPPTPPGAK